MVWNFDLPELFEAVYDIQFVDVFVDLSHLEEIKKVCRLKMLPHYQQTTVLDLVSDIIDSNNYHNFLISRPAWPGNVIWDQDGENHRSLIRFICCWHRDSVTSCKCCLSQLHWQAATRRTRTRSLLLTPIQIKFTLKKICIYKSQKKTNNYTIQSDQYTNDWGRWILLRHKCRYHRIHLF